MKKQFIITLPLLLGRACPVLRSGAGVGLLLLAFAYAMLLPACHKDPPDPPVPPPAVLPDTLPPLTTVGANTFGCYVNGKLWLPKADWKAYADPTFAMIQSSLVEKNGAGGYITVKTSTDSARQTISFGMPCRIGSFYTYPIDSLGPNRFSVWCYDRNTGKWYYPDDNKINENNRLSIINLDTSSNIISGTFNFTLYRGWNDKITDRKDSVVFEQGRFDIRYSQ